MVCVRQLSGKCRADYPRYNPIQKFGPQDCIGRLNAIVEKIDQLIAANNTAAIQQLKGLFGLQEVEDIRDFVYTIAFPSMSFPLSKGVY